MPLGLADTITQLDIDNGSLSYAHDGGEVHTDLFTFTASDISGGVPTPAEDFSITITPVNDEPIAFDDTYTAFVDTELDVDVGDGVLANDADPDGDVLSAVVQTPPFDVVWTRQSDRGQ